MNHPSSISSFRRVACLLANFEIVIPPDTTAIIELPKIKSGKLTPSGKSITENPDIMSLPSSPALHRLQVGSGHYRFSSK